MKRMLLAFATLVSATPALAADPVEETPPPVVTEPAVYDWNGGYIGIYKGGSWVNGNFRFDGDSANEDFNGFTLGKFVGYNVMYDSFVVGAEADLTYSWNDNSYRALGEKHEVGTDWGGSLRGRLGYAVDNTLIYATGGWAFTNGFIDTPGGGDADHTFNGWTLGAGVDWAVMSNVFVRAEYRFTNYGNAKLNGIKVDLDQNQALLGVAYRF